MQTVVIAVGKEILTGKTVNTNLKDIALKLKQIGIDVNRSFVIDDIKEEYFKILDNTKEDLIIFTGGLGPTIDDITRETVYEYYKIETHLDIDMLAYIKSIFDNSGTEMKDTNNKQALLPNKCIVLHNELGTAPGVYFTSGKKHIALLPGPPHEMNPMMDNLKDIIKKELDISLISKGFKLVGTGESTMEDALKGFYEKHPLVNIAPYANMAEIKYIFTSSDEKALEVCLSEFELKFKRFIYGDLDDTLEGVIVKELSKQEKTISFAESCTGGMLASTIVNVSGSSAVFNEGHVTYANEAKMKYLKVSKAVLDEFGAVSNECAYEMVKGLHDISHCDYGISVTGIAGPGGGSIEKPVGLVYFGVYNKGEITTHRKVFNGNRLMIRTRATKHALNLVRGVLYE